MRASSVAIIHSDVPPGAPEEEQDTVCMAEQLEAHLRGMKVRAVCMPYREATLAQDLEAVDPDLIINMVESIDGRADRIHLVPDRFTRLGYRCCGVDGKAMLETTDKLATKTILTANGLPTPRFLDVHAIADADRLDFRVILKSRLEEASFGIGSDSITHDADALRAVLADRVARFGGEWFAEEFVDGREIHAALIQHGDGFRVLPLAEINFSGLPDGAHRIVDYNAKWSEDSFLYGDDPCLFGTVPMALTERINCLARECWQVFNLKGWARIDFRIDAGSGQPMVIDVNANPSLAEGCMFMRAANEGSMQYPDVIGALIEIGDIEWQHSPTNGAPKSIRTISRPYGI